MMTALNKRLAVGVMKWHAHDGQYFVDLGDCQEGRQYETVGFYLEPREPEEFEPHPQHWHPEENLTQAFLVAERIGGLELHQEGLSGGGRWAAKFRGIAWIIERTPSLAISRAAAEWHKANGTSRSQTK